MAEEFDAPRDDAPAPSAGASSAGSLRAPFADSAAFPVEPQTLPLLSSTPPVVAKALVRAYPYVLVANKMLLVATWTNDDYWLNVALMCGYGFFVVYFEAVVTWAGHVVLALVLVWYAVANRRIAHEAARRPSLDDVVHALSTTTAKADLLLSPVTQLRLSAYDVKRLVFTTVFLTPVYVAATVLVVPPRTLLLALGLVVLLYHLACLRVCRRLLWLVRLTRVLCFYLTGLDFLRARRSLLVAAAFAKVQRGVAPAAGDGAAPVRFTYVLYENQRRWLGIGWTANLLTYERAPWTDEFLNELASIDTFELPNADAAFARAPLLPPLPDLAAAHWRWVDKAWRLDLTNDGAIALPAAKRSKTTANPTADEGFIFYDNVWKKPSTEDSFSKYTRRRRWIRTAELVFGPDSARLLAVDEVPLATRRKSLRFDDSADAADAKKDV